MQPVTKSRAAILERIRKANGTASSGEVSRLAEWNAVPREYRRQRVSNDDELLDLFNQRIRHYQANAFQLEGKSIPERVSELLNARGKKRLIIAPAVPLEYLPAEGFEFISDENLSNGELDRSDGVLTGCLLGVALSGSIVLESAPAQGRRATTLIPDYHLCLLRRSDIVEFLPEAMAKLERIKNRPITFFSGPSATVDIEMTTVRGVHGPRTLDVLIF